MLVGSMRTTLKQRHKCLIRIRVIGFSNIQTYKFRNCHVACPHEVGGFRQYPEIDYRELDLPDMAQMKSSFKQIETS